MAYHNSILNKVQEDIMLKIGIIVGSVRDHANGTQVGEWTLNYANSRNDEGVEYELVALKDYDLPMLTTAAADATGEAVDAWKAKMASFDGYVFITPEYNRSVSGAFKNALDFLQPELHNKAVGYAGYGGLGGLAAISSLRLVAAEQEMADVRTMLTFSLMADFENFSVFKPHDYHVGNAKGLFDQLISWSTALKTIR